MLDFIFTEKYETSMENLRNKISEKTYNDLELFFINTNLDHKQRTELVEMISTIFLEGGASDNTKSNVRGKASPKIGERGPRSWEY